MALSCQEKNFLTYQAYELRRLTLLATTKAGSGHPTSALSAADIVACIFFHAMRLDPDNFNNPENDRFILSSGHIAPLLYASWVLLGKLTKEEFLTYRQMGSTIEGHPTRRFKYSEAATGSLGQGLSIGTGYDLSRKIYNNNFYTYVLMGDAESAEGSVWEAAEIAAHYKTDHLIAILNINRLGQSSPSLWGHDIKKYKKAWQAFGWHTISIDGHDIQEIVSALDEAKKISGKPIILLAHTYKGYPLHEVQNKMGFHGKALKPEQLDNALEELVKQSPSVKSYTPQPYSPPKPDKKSSTKPFISINLPQPNYKQGDMIATRVAYGQALAAAGHLNPRIIALDAEVKNSTFAELFENEFPERFVQCFVAEQNMIGMGVGFANLSSIPFISTFGAFHTRAFDQERMAAIARTPLRLCGSHAGVSIGEDGPSQMALEDIALMRTLPNSVVLYPSDAVSSYKLVELMANHQDSISYLRTSRPKTPVIYDNKEEFKIGGCKVHKQSENDKAIIIGAGITFYEALKAHDFLKIEGVNTAIIDLYSIKPLDTKTIVEVARKSGNLIITVEDHYLSGGIGEAVTSALRNTGIKIISLGVTKIPQSGPMKEQLIFQQIDALSIAETVKKMI